MQLDLSLEGITTGEDKQPPPKRSKKGKEREVVMTAASTAEKFLSSHLTAKIVVVVDTHCLDNGFLVYTGASTESYKACTLKEVSTTYGQIYRRPNFPTDPNRMYPERGWAVPPRLLRHPHPHAQEHHSQSDMRSVGFQ